MVIEGENARLAVELDGDKYHPPEKLNDDLERQAMLERAGWRFERIRGTKFFRNEEAALAPLYKRFDELGIKPRSTEVGGEQRTDEVTSDIRSRAAQIAAEWAASPAAEVSPKARPSSRVPDEPRVEVRPAPPKPLATPEVRPEVILSRRLGRPFNMERFAQHAKVSMKSVQDIAWKTCLCAAEPQESLPLQHARQIAEKLEIELES